MSLLVQLKVIQEMMKMATVGVEFSFNGLMAFVCQIDGICMGGPIIANTFVGYYKRKFFNGSVNLKMYVRYMDDR